MAVVLDERMVTRIAELLDLFAELPSTPPVLTDEAREFAATLLEQLERAHRPAQEHRHGS